MKRGLSLIELLVALSLTGIVVWLAFVVFSGQSKSYTRTRERLRLQADSREALRLIEADIRNMGYKSTVSISANRIRSSMGTCSDAWSNAATGDSSSFDYVNSTTLSGDELNFLFHEANSGSLSSCTNLRKIGFRKSGSLLQRRWCSGNCTTEPWISLLDSVVSFQVRYGMIALPNDTSSANGASQTATATRWTTGSLVKSGTVPNLTLTGWTTTRQQAIYGFPIDSLDPTHTWQVSFTCTPNAALLADMDTSSFRVGFFNSNGTVSGTRDTVTFFPGYSSSSPRTLVVNISPSTSATSGRYLGIEGRLKSSTQSGWSLAISDFNAIRISRGRYTWVEAPTIAQKNKVKAIDLRLLVKARHTTDEASPGPFDANALGQTGLVFTPSGADEKRSYVMFQRVFPVVNNGI